MAMLEVAGCFCEWEGRVLLLLRAPHTHQGSTWCLPGGKLEAGESPWEAARRETYEEAGFWVNSLREVGRHTFPTYLFHMFHAKLPEKPTVALALREHTEYQWVLPREVHTLPLIEGGEGVFQALYG